MVYRPGTIAKEIYEETERLAKELGIHKGVEGMPWDDKYRALHTQTSRKIKAKYKKCPRCKGDGRIHGGYGYYDWSVCPLCQGDGVITAAQLAKWKERQKKKK